MFCNRPPKKHLYVIKIKPSQLDTNSYPIPNDSNRGIVGFAERHMSDRF
jgi:hypothetical protein